MNKTLRTLALLAAAIPCALSSTAQTELATLLDEHFDSQAADQAVAIEGWQNLSMGQGKPFTAVSHQGGEEGDLAAQVAFDDDETPGTREAWLISPSLSYQAAASKTLTFSLRFDNPKAVKGERFDLVISTAEGSHAEDHFLDLDLFKPVGITPEAGKWYDYSIDLSAIDTLKIGDEFQVAFRFFSPTGTTTTYTVDDVTFGRDDLPTISVDDSYIMITNYTPGRAEAKTFNVTTTHADFPVTLTHATVGMDNYITLSPDQLPAEGGQVKATFLSNDKRNHSFNLLLQTRGATPVVIRFFTMADPTGIDAVAAQGKAAQGPRYTPDGRRAGSQARGVVVGKGTKRATR